MTPAQNTKIELVTESIEALVLAVVIATTSGTEADRLMNHENVVDARKVVRTALKELITPTLRVIDGVSAAA